MWAVLKQGRLFHGFLPIWGLGEARKTLFFCIHVHKQPCCYVSLCICILMEYIYKCQGIQVRLYKCLYINRVKTDSLCVCSYRLLSTYSYSIWSVYGIIWLFQVLSQTISASVSLWPCHGGCISDYGWYSASTHTSGWCVRLICRLM